MKILFLLLLPAFCFSQYRVEKRGNEIYSTASNLPTFSGTDFSTVVQSTIAHLTPKGATGSGGGKISIASGNYFLSKAIIIEGWEGVGNPYSQLIIEGDGKSTAFVQNTAGTNAIVVKNAASVVLKDFRVYAGVNALSCLLFDNSGANELSCTKSIIENIDFTSNSPKAPAVYLKNFFDLTVSAITVSNDKNSAIVLENNSNTTNYGNSHFSFVRTVSSPVAPFGGLVIRSTNASKFINMLTFDNYECVFGYYGIYSTCLKFSVFNFLDIEGIPYPVVFDGANGNETRDVKILAGYILPANNGTAITNTLYTSGNSISAVIEADGSVTPLLDQQQYRIANAYELTLGHNVNVSKIKITDQGKTKLVVKKQ